MDQQEVLGDAVLAGYMQELGAGLTLVESDDIGDLKFVNTAESEDDYLDDMAAGEPVSTAPVVEAARATQVIDDSEFADTKLRGYELVTDLKTMYPGDHMRITQNKYRQEGGRKCSYIILKRYDVDAGVWWVNGFKSSYPDWKISVRPLNRYKQVRFYRRVKPEYTGICETCSRTVKKPYLTCYGCRRR